MRKEVWRGKELVESIFIKVEPGIAVLGSCCVSSAWSSHIKLCLVCIRAAQDRGTRGSPCVWDPQAHPPALQCHGWSPQLTCDCLGTAFSLIPTIVSISEMQRWKINPKNGHSGLDDVPPIVLSHHHLLFWTDNKTWRICWLKVHAAAQCL